MRSSHLPHRREIGFAFFALICFFAVCFHFTAVAFQTPGLRIKESSPVVNEGNQIKLTAVDSSDRPASSAIFESDSPEVASVDAASGMVMGVKSGFATITARKGNDSFSVFIAVTRVESKRGTRSPGDAKTDNGGRIYLSDPIKNVILRKDGFDSQPDVFAGKDGTRGFNQTAQNRINALFAGPTAVAVDNSPQGGVYIADTLNHSIRKIDFTDNVTTPLGKGMTGAILVDSVPFNEALFNGPQGVAVNNGGNLFIADTGNHAVYVADFANKTVRLLAGEPGVSGKSDGKGRQARFSKPASIAVSPDGKFLVVADAGNNRVRFITMDGTVFTAGSRTNPAAFASADASETDQTADEIVFDSPQSVGFDDAGNLYIVDDSGPMLAAFPLNQPVQIFPLAQPSVSFSKAASVAIKGTAAVVLDGDAANEGEAVKIVTVGGPQIDGLSPDADGLEGGSEIIITGKNFAPESQVFLSGELIADAAVESAKRIRIPRTPAQLTPGRRVLSVRTRGGLSQTDFFYTSKPLAELSDGQITTIAGGTAPTGDGGSALFAGLDIRFGGGIATDAAGNLYIADFLNHRIRRVDPSGFITTVAGNGIGGFNGEEGHALSVRLDSPQSVAVDRDGNLFIADTANSRIRRVDALTGLLATVAGTSGNGNSGFGGDGGPAVKAVLSIPEGIAIDGAGNIFIADTFNNRVRRVDAKTGVINTVAGNGMAGFGGDNGPAANARLNQPTGIAADGAGNLFIADQINRRIRRVNASGVITTVAGNGVFGLSGDGSSAVNASFVSPRSLTVDAAGNLFIVDTGNHRIRRVDAKTGTIDTAAGSGPGGGEGGFAGDGGVAVGALLNRPQSAAVDGLGNLFVADGNNNRIRKVDGATGIIDAYVGNGASAILGDGDLASKARLNAPRGIEADADGNIYIADTGNNRVRRIDANTGIISTIAGNGVAGSSGDGGPGEMASLNQPGDVAVDDKGNVYIADALNARVRRLDRSGKIAAYAGTGTAGFSGEGGPATAAQIGLPQNLALDKEGNLFIADSTQRVRRVDAAELIITTAAGTGIAGFGGEGGPALSASFNAPNGIALDAEKNLIISDRENNRIRRVDAAMGNVITIAGNGTTGFSGDGDSATRASLGKPRGIGIDGAGNVFIPDTLNNRVRMVDGAGIIRTVAGGGCCGLTGDGGDADKASLGLPFDATADKFGNLYILDNSNNAVRAVKGAARGTASDFSLSVNPPSQTAAAGAAASFTINSQAVNDFSQTIILSASVNPPTEGISLRLSANSIRPGGNATLTASVAANTPPSTFTIAVTGSAGQLVRRQTITLTVAPRGGMEDFAVIISPGSQTVTASGSTSFTVNLQSSGGFSQPAALSASVNPPGAGVDLKFSSNQITPGANSTLTVSTTLQTSFTTYTITVSATSGQIVRTQNAALNVISPNTPPSITPISDQTLRVGETRSIPVTAVDPNGNEGLKLMLVAAPTFAAFTDNGGGRGVLRLAPTPTDLQGGEVLIQVVDPIGLTSQIAFAVTVQADVVISNAMFAKSVLTIRGIGLGQSAAIVKINGMDVSSAITSQSDASIILKGNKKKLGLKKGENQITVTVNGTVSNTFVFTFFT